MNEIDFGLKKTIDTTCGLKEMNDNVTKVEVICDDDIAGESDVITAKLGFHAWNVILLICYKHCSSR